MRWACVLAVEGGENVGDGIGRQIATACLKQSADYDANHVVQKPVAGNGEAHLVSEPLDTQSVNAPDGGALHVL